MPASPSLFARLIRHFWLKALGTPAFMVAFFVAYFAILRHPPSAPTLIPLTALDRWIGFHPAALIPYASLWFYVILPTALMIKVRELIDYVAGAAALSVAGLAVFYFWPTATPAPDINWAAYPSIQFLKSMDATGNACPSLHVAFSVFTAIWLGRMLRRIGASPLVHAVNVLWAVAILYSTLATRQHVAIDLFAGALLGGLAGWINLRLSAPPDET